MQAITLRPFEDDDLPLFARWLSRDYIQKWYHDPDDWLDEIRRRHGDFGWLHHFIVMADGVAVGFCQYYDCFDANALEDWYTVTTPGETYSIDYLIGQPDYLGRGYGTAIVARLTEMVRALGGQEIIVNPEAENLPSCGALRANGYVFEPEGCLYRKNPL
jgi:RimJ/RimL family protein N-acetyltransferase